MSEDTGPLGWLLHQHAIGFAAALPESLRVDALVVAGIRKPSNRNRRDKRLGPDTRLQSSELPKLNQQVQRLIADKAMRVRSLLELADRLEKLDLHAVADESGLYEFLVARLAEVEDVTLWGGVREPGRSFPPTLPLPRLEYARFVLSKANEWIDQHDICRDGLPNRPAADNISETIESLQELRRWLREIVRKRSIGPAGLRGRT